ncbi:MAG: ArsA family ATPase [Actinomycetaceae bacterium]|nr:ArsA family ATPase [Actinomycetaceae bacterium]
MSSKFNFSQHDSDSFTHLLDRKIVFVGGKGGVGKTSVSSALAYQRMLQNERVLLVSTDPAHNLGHLWDAQLDDKTTRLATSETGFIDGVEIDPHRVVDQHFDAVYDQMLRLLPEQLHGPAKRHLDSARHAPGSHESAILERVAENVELGLKEYDVVIFDTAPTGHTLHLLTMPEQLSTWTEQLLKSRQRSDQYSAILGSIVGTKETGDAAAKESELRRALIRRQELMSRLRDALKSDAGFAVVTIAEPMPIAESLDLLDQLDHMRVHVDGVIVNRRSPTDAGAFLAHKHALENTQLQRLQREVRNLPIRQIPLLQDAPQGIDGIEAVAHALFATNS